ncbi:hypothetical protein HDU88_005318 [Geranomyces variabilis]|nr:hypothetical protein HDU88_005318 [Geranomyces variabilis]
MQRLPFILLKPHTSTSSSTTLLKLSRQSVVLYNSAIPRSANQLRPTAHSRPLTANAAAEFATVRMHSQPIPRIRFLPPRQPTPATALTNTDDLRVATDLFHATRRILAQYAALLAEFERRRNEGAELYTRQSRFVMGSTVGKHVRHVLDHFRILLAETKASPSSSSSNEAPAPTHHEDDHSHVTPPPQALSPDGSPLSLHYDTHPPHRSLSQSPGHALAELRVLDAQIRGLAVTSARALDTPVAIGVVVTPNAVDAEGGGVEDPVFASSLGREIWHLCHHAIHHAALIRVICMEHSIPVPDSFGIAPSTQKHAEQRKDEDKDGGGSGEKSQGGRKNRRSNRTSLGRL